MKKKVIIDCDPGMDDSAALILALKSPELEVLAITAAAGNYPLDVTSANARKVLELLGRTEVPVAGGCAHPLVCPAPSDPFTHGRDGQGENFLPAPTIPLAGEHAVDLIIRQARANPGELWVLCLAPMTNLALALRKAPELKDLLAGVVAISGAFGLNEYAFLNGTGDNPQSEWNVYFDPEAAKVVYESGVNLVALGLDVCTHFEVNFSDGDLEALEKSPRPECGFLRQAIRFNNGRGFQSYCTIIDCMAVGYAVDPTLVETVTGKVGVETRGELTLGMTVLDRRHHHAWAHLPDVRIGKTADYGRFLALLLERFLA